MNYFVVMRDFKQLGREAVVNPEYTRRDIIDLIASGEWSDVLWVHEIEDGTCRDVTQDIATEIYRSSDGPFSHGVLEFLQRNDAAPIGLAAE